MTEVVEAARGGMPVLGICNGFQILCEAGLLPGALMRNEGLHFICRDEWLRVEATDTAWTSRFEAGAEILVPAQVRRGPVRGRRAHVLDELEGEGRVAFRYAGDNPNGAAARNRRHRVGQRTCRRTDAAPRARHRGADRPVATTVSGLFFSALDAVLAA